MAKEKDDIERYREGSLSMAERHALEMKALNDPFLADALEGAETVSPGEFSTDLAELSKKLQHRQSTRWFTPVRIAAGIVVLLTASFLVYYFNSFDSPTLALEKSPGSPVKNDSITKSQKDSVSGLLTLAKPKESVNESEHAAPKASLKNSDKAGQGKGDVTKSTSGAAETQIAEAKPVPEERAEEEKTKKNALDEAKEEKKITEVAPVQSLASGAGAENKKESAGLGHTDLRRAQKKNADAKTADAFQPTITNAAQNIAGKVTSVEDGSALPGVNVLVKGSAQGTITDSEGNYQINTQTNNARLVFSSMGMETKEVNTNNQGPLNVQMRNDSKQQSEVAVSGYGVSKDDDKVSGDNAFPETELAQPVGGKEAFEKYLETNLRYPAKAINNKTEGKVTIQFTVNADGSTQDYSIIKGIGDGCDEELIRLIQEGPKWLPTRRNKIALEDKVKVRLTFSIPR